MGNGKALITPGDAEVVRGAQRIKNFPLTAYIPIYT